MKVPITFATVDVTEYRDIGQRFDITGIPTLKLFRRNRPAIEYSKKHDVNDIAEWLVRKIGAPVREINTIDEAELMLMSNKLVIFGFFDDFTRPKVRRFIELAGNSDDHVMAMTGNDELMEYFGVDPNTIYLFKNYPLDDSTVQLTDTKTVAKMEEFIRNNLLPEPIRELDDYYYQRILADVDYTRTYLFAFLSESAGHYTDDHLTNITEICQEVIHDFLYCATINVDLEINQVYLELFNVTLKNVPTVIFGYFGEDAIESQKMAGKSFDISNLRFFAEHLVESFYLKNLPGQPLPKDWDAKPVKILVKDNFYETIQDPERDVVVLYHGEW